MKAKITRVIPDIPLPEYHTGESAGFDIAAGEGMVIQPGQVAKVRSGLIIEAPQGYFMMLTCRSSLSSKKGLHLANGVGTIDRDFSGPEDEFKIILHNFTTEPVIVAKGERLVQGIFLPVSQVQWEEVEQIREESRGGIGSTGGYAAETPNA
jgi:dUTP pyrophosphatase